ncbi:MAG: hypothetical protein RLY31_1962 [Bacteroidota bacterium]
MADGNQAARRRTTGPGTRHPYRETLFIKGARANNLKNIDLEIPKNQLVVVTGVSGSGKSSVTMDTLFAEGQRRYVESLSSYARQFLGRLKKPEVDFIKGICPAIAVEQKVSTANARSTVGTLTELYDHLRLLYARIGRTYSPVSGLEVRRHYVTDIVDFIHAQPDGTRIQLFVPIPAKYADRSLGQELTLLLQKGYTRLRWADALRNIQDLLEGVVEADLSKPFRGQDLLVLVDRFVVRPAEEENKKRIADSVQTAMYEGEGEAMVEVEDAGTWHTHRFNTRFEADGMEFLEPTPQLFNFNNPYGACPTCEGFSLVIGISEEKVIPDPGKSLFEGAVACWTGEKYGEWLQAFLRQAHRFDFPVHRPWAELSDDQQRLVWEGNAYFQGIREFFRELESQLYKIQNRVMLARYRGRTRCPDCRGGRLRQEATYVRIAGKTLPELTELPVGALLPWFDSLAEHLSETERQVASRLLLESGNRLRSMVDLGLSYLTLNRLSSTLSGGETQRINLTRTLGSNLTASLYILDEPSVGLHPRDTGRLVRVLQQLRDLGNTVVVVEHEEDVIKHADFLVDIGPAAGIHGGEVVFAGPYGKIHEQASDSLTTQYMSGRMSIPLPATRREATHWLELTGCRHHNLRNIDVRIPLHSLTVVTGVSGSGKTTLVKDIIYPALKTYFDEPTNQSPGPYKTLHVGGKAVTQVEMVSQSPIGRSSRSNPVTYVKAYDSIRNLMAKQPLSKVRGYKPGHFSFNVEGGRCETCQGEGEQVVEMQFLADVRLECEDCHGKRFKPEMLDVRFREKNIHDILELSIEESLTFFEDQPDIIARLKPLHDVGLGYVKLGQSSSTLSGGEAQRVKLASFLTGGGSKNPLLFIFDEPTTGLHFHDIRKLLDALSALLDNGHSVLVVEHNLEVVKTADWVIDLGPEGGQGGGALLYQGPPEGLPAVPDSWTGRYLAEKLPRGKA